jgi:AcrR family transcriptional regulator
VGSLYQYFPNKAAILFRLQADEWRRTSELLRSILEDGNRPPMERLRTLVHTFLRSECEEADVRTALGDAAPLYRDAPEADAARASGSLVVRDFLGEFLPCVDARAVALAADLIEATLTQVGSSFSGTERTDDEIAAYADAMADMFCAYLASLSNRAGGRRSRPASRTRTGGIASRSISECAGG